MTDAATTAAAGINIPETNPIPAAAPSGVINNLNNNNNNINNNNNRPRPVVSQYIY